MTNRIPTVMANSTALNATAVSPMSQPTCFTSVYCSQCCFFSRHIYGRCGKRFPSSYRCIIYITNMLVIAYQSSLKLSKLAGSN